MSFASPIWLLALLAVPLALAATVAGRRRARRYAVRFPAVTTLLEAAGGVPAWRRHLPAALALAAVVALALAAAKPTRSVRVALRAASIVLVTDHSGSMQARDVAPTRLAAAQRAAHGFIDALPAGVRLGVVAFSAQPDSVQAPTTDHAVTSEVIDAQAPNGATATGDALATALGLLRSAKANPDASAIVLLSDGSTTTGRNPIGVAQQARQRKVPIYTVALGTQDALVPNPNPFGAPLPAPPDPETLARIARITRAQSFSAQDAGRLDTIYKRLGSQLGSRSKDQELTAGFAAAGLLLLLGAGLTSVRFGGRLP